MPGSTHGRCELPPGLKSSILSGLKRDQFAKHYPPRAQLMAEVFVFVCVYSSLCVCVCTCLIFLLTDYLTYITRHRHAHTQTRHKHAYSLIRMYFTEKIYRGVYFYIFACMRLHTLSLHILTHPHECSLQRFCQGTIAEEDNALNGLCQVCVFVRVFTPSI